MSSASLNKGGFLLRNPGDQKLVCFTPEHAVTCQATRWRSGVRQVRAEAAASLGNDVGMASD